MHGAAKFGGRFTLRTLEPSAAVWSLPRSLSVSADQSTVEERLLACYLSVALYSGVLSMAHPGLRAGLAALVVVGVVARSTRLRRTAWIGATGYAAAVICIRPMAAANHLFLLAAVGALFAVAGPDRESRADAARLLLGVVLLAAGAQKLLAADLLHGYWAAMIDLGGWFGTFHSPFEIDRLVNENRVRFGALMRRPPGAEDIELLPVSRHTWLGDVLGGSVIALELGLGGWWLYGRRARLAAIATVGFVLGTFLVRAEGGFLSLLLVLCVAATAGTQTRFAVPPFVIVTCLILAGYAAY